MRFHMHLLPTYYPDRDAPFPQYFQQILEQVQLAEELGFECFWFTEHHFLLYGGPVPNPAVMMSAAAARTSKIHLGSAISILPLHHPLQIAEDYAMVDVVSGGRLEFGVGLGNTDIDFLAYGVPREQSWERFVEAADVITAAWSNERLNHRGKFWSFEDVAVYPRPVQHPHPRFWFAGGSVEHLSWAGAHGYNIMTVAHPYPPERLRPSVSAWREALPAAHKSEGLNKLHLRVWVDESDEKAASIAQPAIERYDTLMRTGRTSRVPVEATYDWEGMLAQGRNVYGTPEHCIQQIQRTAENYDFDIFSACFNFGGIPHEEAKRSMRLFAKEVMPALK
jgi:alkanesulfonate monooxygenase SsuD/methylene tetrahydromethanopterin reductase-like flavin-dependent oxidoreductase (luciferase family)